MAKKLSYNKLLSKYPEYVSKEQFRLIAHISKRTARYYLQNGLIPCIDSGKKTRNYIIAMRDIVIFLIDREAMPEKYRMPQADPVAKAQSEMNVLPPDPEGFTEQLLSYYEMLLENYGDLLTVTEMSEIVRYSRKVVFTWLREKKLKYFASGNKFYIPKECLITYMIGCEYRGRKHQSPKQIKNIGGFLEWQTQK